MVSRRWVNSQMKRDYLGQPLRDKTAEIDCQCMMTDHSDSMCKDVRMRLGFEEEPMDVEVSRRAEYPHQPDQDNHQETASDQDQSMTSLDGEELEELMREVYKKHDEEYEKTDEQYVNMIWETTQENEPTRRETRPHRRQEPINTRGRKRSAPTKIHMKFNPPRKNFLRQKQIGDFFVKKTRNSTELALTALSREVLRLHNSTQEEPTSSPAPELYSPPSAQEPEIITPKWEGLKIRDNENDLAQADSIIKVLNTPSPNHALHKLLRIQTK